MLNIKARFDLCDIIGSWEDRHGLTLPQAIELLEKELAAHRQALVVLNQEERESKILKEENGSPD